MAKVPTPLENSCRAVPKHTGDVLLAATWGNGLTTTVNDWAAVQLFKVTVTVYVVVWIGDTVFEMLGGKPFDQA